MTQPTRREVAETTAEVEQTMRPQTVPINMYEASQALVVLAPLPAAVPDDVHIEVRGGTLRFWSHVRSAGPREYLVHEWEYGGFEREVDLPEGYGSGLEASLANGQLAIRVFKGDATDVEIHPTAHPIPNNTG